MRWRLATGIAILVIVAAGCAQPESPAESGADAGTTEGPTGVVSVDGESAGQGPSEETAGAAKVATGPKCPQVTKGKGLGTNRNKCPGDFATVWLTLAACADECPDCFPNGLIVVSPELAEIWQQKPPYRVAWVVNERKQYKWSIERKAGATGTDIFPGGPKSIDNPAFDAFFSDDPSGAAGGDKWEYKVVVTKANGDACAEVDPEIRVKDDPPPPDA